MNTIGRTGAAVALIAVAGCSGGGGGGIAAAEINAANAAIIAGATLSAVIATGDLNSLDDIAGDLGEPPTAPGRTAATPPVAEITVAVDNSDLDVCLTGAVRGTLSVKDPNVVAFEDRLLPGDGGKLNLSRCELEPGEVYSGGIDFRVTRFEGTLCMPVEYILEFRLRNLVSNDSAETERADGDISLFYSRADFPVIDTALSGRRLDIDEQGQSASLRNYELATQYVAVLLPLPPGAFGVPNCQSYSLPQANESIQVSYDGYLSSSTFDGEVQFITLEPFVFAPPLETPTQGRLIILGAANASVELIVDGSVVRLAIDSDGDGLSDVSTTSTWSTLTDPAAS